MKKALVVIDMQNDFISGSLGTPEAMQIVSDAVDKITTYKNVGWDIIATMDTHDAAYLDTREGRQLPVAHCIKGTEGWQLHPAIAEACAAAKTFEKPGFGSVELAAYLRDNHYSTIEFIGLCTDICVIANAMLARSFIPEADITVDGNVCAGVSPASHHTALDAMGACHIEVI